MSNRDKYKKEVNLIEAVLRCVNVTQADRVSRLYDVYFVQNLGSDQDFFESINWYCKKVINIASVRSLRASRKYDFTKIRFWNSVIICLTPLLGDHPFYETNSMVVHVEDMI